MGTVDAVATDVDRFLMDRHIGEYEALLLWHEHAKQLRARSDYARALGGVLRDKTKHGHSRDFCRALVRHYDRA
jgi:hypothetical protein